MDTTQRLDLIRDIDLFAHVDPDTLADIAARFAERPVEPGEAVFREGDPGGYVFLIASGTVEVRKCGEGDREVLMRVMGPGEVGGLTSTALGRDRSATLLARKPVRILVLDRDVFLDLLDRHQDLVRSVLAHLGDKVRGKTARLANQLARDRAGTGEPVAVFDTKPHDRRHLDAAAGDIIAPQYFEARLEPATASLASGFRVVCAFVNDDLGAGVLEELAAAGVELVAMRCAGYNNVDLEAAAEHGITVVRVPGYSPHAVAEHAVALMLTLNRKTHRAHQRVREGNFSLSGLVGFDLHGRTAGVVGLGQIGRCLAEILRGFGMEVLAHDPYPDEEFASRTGVEYVELDDLLSRSDIVSLNAPLTPDTHHVIDARAIKQMKDGAMLINTSRGGLVDTTALLDGLKSGKLGSAGLDVYEEEGGKFFEDLSDVVITDDVLARLLTFPNVLVTSHQAFFTVDALDAIAETTVGNIGGFLEGKRGEELGNVVERD